MLRAIQEEHKGNRQILIDDQLTIMEIERK